VLKKPSSLSAARGAPGDGAKGRGGGRQEFSILTDRNDLRDNPDGWVCTNS